MNQEANTDEVYDDEDTCGMSKPTYFPYAILDKREDNILNCLVRLAERKMSFLDLLLSATKGDPDLSDTMIQNEVDTFMFAVRLIRSFPP